MTEEYVCAVCGKTFEKEPGSEEIALKNMRERYGDLKENERAIVCDGCWKKAHPVVKALDYKVDDEMLRLLHVIQEMQSRGHKVVGLIGVKKEPNGDEEMELVWGTDDSKVTDELEQRVVRAILEPDATGVVRGTAKVDPKEGLSWEKEPWIKVN